MAKLEFRDLEFRNEKDKVRVIFLKHFHFYIGKKELEKIGKFSIGNNFIKFDTEKTQKFYHLIDRGLESLKSTITGKKAIYIHKNSGIPLIGNNSFGIVDRGSNLIEIKPFCGCNLDCIYCSVDENKRVADFVLEKDYLVEELKKVVEIKKNDVEVHIGCQGEPLLYSPLIELVSDISKIPKVKNVSMDTNAVLLTEKSVDELTDAGMTQFNLSINALDKELAKKMAGCGYTISHVKKIAEYISKKPVRLTIAPVWVNGINDEEMDNIILFGKKIGVGFGIQNFLKYSLGKTPAKEVPMKEFYKRLEILEKKHKVKLILSAEDFRISPDNSPKKPFRKGDVVKAEIICGGRLPNEVLAKAENRLISVFNCIKKGDVKIRIIRSKHNIYSGVCI